MSPFSLQVQNLCWLTLASIIDWRVANVIEWVYLESTDDADNDKPEPEEDVDFLVDDVQGEDAESVKPLNSTRRTELVEGAFSHLGKHPGYGDAKKNILRIKKPFLSNLRLVTEVLQILFKGALDKFAAGIRSQKLSAYWMNAPSYFV